MSAHIMDSNTVTALKSCSFRTLTLNQKLKVKSDGRPTPKLNIKEIGKCRNTTYERKFHTKMYETTPWLCGCEVTNKLFCFPCILFRGEDAWSKEGICDLKRLAAKIKKHDLSSRHVNASIDLAMLGRVNSLTQIDMGHQMSIDLHNHEVTKNRVILSKIINCIRFCGVFELALLGHDETENSEHPGIFRGLINFTSELDLAMKTHVEEATVFKGTYKTIQNELLDCMLEVCREKITEEIENTQFLAIMAYETTDVSDCMQMVVVYRYVDQVGKAVERFWGFVNLGGQGAEILPTCILRELAQHVELTPDKLIAQSYDGAAVMSGVIGAVQKIVRGVYQYAYFVDCYAHQLNLAMKRASSQNTDVRIFFSDLSDIPEFFTRSPQRFETLDELAHRIPGVAPTRWNFNIRTVNVVHENKNQLFNFFKTLAKDSKSTQKTIAAASGLCRTMKDPTFNFWLAFFDLLMPQVDILYNQLQRRQSDSLTVDAATSNFIQTVQNIRDATVVEPPDNDEDEDLRRFRKKELRLIAAKEVCDIITTLAKDRFRFSNHLEAHKLLQSESFVAFSEKFPEDVLELAIKTYPMIRKEKLRLELTVLYQRPEFDEHKGAIHLLQLLIQNNLETTFSETIKLLRILITTPMSTAEPERCFSTLNRIKTFLRSTVTQDRLCALTMLSIEKNMITNMHDFNLKVINKFAALENRRMNFNFK